jgi:hypothetical protein
MPDVVFYIGTSVDGYIATADGSKKTHPPTA